VQKVSVKKVRVKLIVAIAVLATLTGCAKTGPQKPSPEAAQQLLKLRGYEFNVKSFHSAIQASDRTAVIAFLDGGISVNEQIDPDRETALIVAATQGDLSIVKLLLERKADPNISDKNGFTPFYRALGLKHDDIADLLAMQPNLNLNQRGLKRVTLLITYASRDREDIVKSLIERGADVTLRDDDDDTALHLAAQNGNVNLTKLLLDKGAPINAQNKVGGTALMWAASKGNVELAQLLLERGADASIKDEDGTTALGWAIKNKRDNVQAILKGK
jgi:uncharacterized protein